LGFMPACPLRKTLPPSTLLLRSLPPPRRVHGCRSAGIRLLDADTRGTIERNDVYDNAKAGIHIEGLADPLVVNNTIRGRRESCSRSHATSIANR